jgi:hypothetical protein
MMRVKQQIGTESLWSCGCADAGLTAQELCIPAWPGGTRQRRGISSRGQYDR